MHRFATGFLAGSIIGAVGLSVALSDRHTRRRIVREGRRAMHKASDAIDDITRKR